MRNAKKRGTTRHVGSNKIKRGRGRGRGKKTQRGGSSEGSSEGGSEGSSEGSSGGDREGEYELRNSIDPSNALQDMTKPATTLLWVGVLVLIGGGVTATILMKR